MTATATRKRHPGSEAHPLASGGGGARREIAWAELDASALGDAGRRTVGATWRERMKQEHLAVGAFALLAQELAEEGADPIVLSLVTRASADEVRHAEVCKSFAIALLGEASVEPRLRGLPRVPGHETASSRARVLFHLVEMCCLSETLTGVYLTEMLARTTDPVARAAVESLLEDEIDHGRVGWAYLSARVKEGPTEGLAAALPAMIDRTFRGVLSAAQRSSEREDATLEACAYLSSKVAGDVYRRTLRDVILPGFETLGVDLGPTRALVRARGWLS
jgi:hypothetical protein